jgi:vancomycin permeability regulator SanA
MKLIKRLFLLGVAMGVGLVLMLVGVFYIVKWNADARLYDNVADVPYNKVALLLGTNPVTK